MFPSQDEPDPYMKIKEFRYSISTLFMHMGNFNYLVAVTKKLCKKDVLKIFAKVTGKHLFQNLLFNKLPSCSHVTY